MPAPKGQFEVVVIRVPVGDESELTVERKARIQERLDGANLYELFPLTAENPVIITKFETIIVK